MNQLIVTPDDDLHRIAVQMLVRNVPNGAIKFFMCVYHQMQVERLLSCADMAKVYGVTAQAAAKHISVLEKYHYFERVHYRAWKLNANKLQDVQNERDYL